MKYKPGDEVKVRSDMIVGQKYGSCTMIKGRKEYLGKILKVCRIIYDDEYALELNGVETGWRWNEEMLEGLAEDEIIVKQINIIKLPIRRQLDILGL